MPNNFDKLFNQSQGNELINALKGIKSSLDVNYPLETVNVTLSNNAQNITPSENYYGLGQVNVPGMNLSDMTILVNGNYDPVTSGLDGYGKLNVNVPNTYGASDEGKVVNNAALVAQTNRSITQNGTYDTTLNNEVDVDVPNTYSASDEGKVVDNGALVSQTSQTITQNGTYDTTLIDELIANISGGGGGGSKNILSGTEAPTSSIGEDGDIYLQYSDTSNRGYLQNTGSSYLNTNYIPKSNSKFVLECNITGGASYFVPFGARETSSTAAAAKGVYTIRGDSYKFGYCFGTALVQQSETNYNDFLDKDITITLSGSLAKITDGTDTLEYSFTGGTPTTYPIFLFGLNQAGVNLADCRCYMKAYRFKIYEGDVLVADYVPAIDDGSAGMRNLIGGIFLGATGTMNVDPYSNAGYIVSTYCKVDGAWQPLIDTDIDDVNTEGSGGAKNILGGTTNPTSADGTDGDIYIKYIDYSAIDGYTVLEYLQSSGNQSIDTGVDITTQSYYETECAATQSTSESNFYGLGYSNKESNIIVASNRIYLQIGSRKISIPYDTAKHLYKANNVQMLIDDTVGTPNWSNVPTGQRIRLFATAYGGNFTSNRISYTKMYYCKIWDGDTLVRNFIPAKRNSDDALGMYDLVNDVFYTNSGTGEFIGGEELTGTPIDTVYLKVDGDWIILEDGDYSEVNTEGDGNIIQGTTAPTSAIGKDGNYYYKGQYKTEALGYLGNFANTAGQTQAGWEFKANRDIDVIGLAGYVRSSNTGSLVLADSSGNILGQIDDVQFSANTLTKAYFDAPIALTSGNNYIVQIWASGLSYVQWASAFDNSINFVRGRYGGLPGNQESNTLYSANIIIEGDGLFRVEEEYYKSNGSWVQLY